MRLHKLALGIGSLALLAGCAQLNALHKTIEYSSLQDDLDAAAGVGVTMPNSGTATYSGVAIMGAKSDTNAVGLMGDAALTADFDAASIAGTIDNFVGVEDIQVDADGNFSDLNDNPVSQTDVIFALKNGSGSLAVNNGSIAGSTFTADFAGDVTLNSTVYSPEGTMSGDFSGADGQLIEASATCDFSVDAGCTDVTVGGIASATGAHFTVSASSN